MKTFQDGLAPPYRFLKIFQGGRVKIPEEAYSLLKYLPQKIFCFSGKL